MAKPVDVDIHGHAEKNTWVRIVVDEGRPHLIKRLFLWRSTSPCSASTGPNYAGISVEGMDPGTWRELAGHEVKMLASGRTASRARRNRPGLPARRHGRGPGGSAASLGSGRRPLRAQSGLARSQVEVLANHESPLPLCRRGNSWFAITSTTRGRSSFSDAQVALEAQADEAHASGSGRRCGRSASRRSSTRRAGSPLARSTPGERGRGRAWLRVRGRRTRGCRSRRGVGRRARGCDARGRSVQFVTTAEAEAATTELREEVERGGVNPEVPGEVGEPLHVERVERFRRAGKAEAGDVIRGALPEGGLEFLAGHGAPLGSARRRAR